MPKPTPTAPKSNRPCWCFPLLCATPCELWKQGKRLTKLKGHGKYLHGNQKGSLSLSMYHIRRWNKALMNIKGQYRCEKSSALIRLYFLGAWGCIWGPMISRNDTKMPNPPWNKQSQHPWDGCIYLRGFVLFMRHVGKNTSNMDEMWHIQLGGEPCFGLWSFTRVSCWKWS